MKFWWTIIKELNAKIESLESQLLTESKLNNIEYELRLLNKKVIPVERKVTNYTVDAIMFSKSLQRFNRKKQCGGGDCQMYYLVPCKEIDSVAKSEEIKKAV